MAPSATEHGELGERLIPSVSKTETGTPSKGYPGRGFESHTLRTINGVLSVEFAVFSACSTARCAYIDTHTKATWIRRPLFVLECTAL